MEVRAALKLIDSEYLSGQMSAGVALSQLSHFL